MVDSQDAIGGIGATTAYGLRRKQDFSLVCDQLHDTPLSIGAYQKEVSAQSWQEILIFIALHQQQTSHSP
jgi:hypothetical protein